MRTIFFCFFLSLAFAGCILEVVDENIEIHSSASGKGVMSASFDASLCRNNFTVHGASDTLIADIGLSLMARNSDHAKRLAQNVRASWDTGAKTGLALTFGGTDKELISLDHIAVQIPDSASVHVDGGETDVTVSRMNGDVGINTNGEISVETNGRISLETVGGKISGSTGLGGEVTTNSGSVDITISSKDFEQIRITQRDSDGVQLHIASGAKIQFKLSTTNGRISVKYDNVSYETSFLHHLISDGDDFNDGSGKVVSIETSGGDITITN